MGREKAPSPVQKLRETLESYAGQSTLHGVSYLASSASGSCLKAGLAQRLFWVLSIAAAYGLAMCLIALSFRETRDFPLVTDAEIVRASQVPVPAVTIDAGDILNPWGPVEKLLNLARFSCFGAPSGCPPEREAVRRDVKGLTSEVVDRFFKAVFGKVKDWPLEKLKHEDRKNMWTKKKFPEFASSVALLAEILALDPGAKARVWRRLENATVHTMARFSMRHVGLATEHLHSVIVEEAERQNQNPSLIEKARACEGNQTLCPDTYIESFAMMMLPLRFNQHASYIGFRVGDFVSDFAKRLLMVGPGLSGDYHTDRGAQLAAYLGSVLKNIKGIPKDLTLYEAPLLMDMLYSESESFQEFPLVRYIGQESPCPYKNAKDYMLSMLSYLGKNFPMDHYELPVEVTQPPCTNDTLDELLGLTSCCGMTQQLKGSHEIILKIMKHTMQSPHFKQSAKELGDDLDFAQILFPSYEVDHFNLTEWNIADILELKAATNENPRIFSSEYSHKASSFAEMALGQHFKRSYTNRGFGYTFNNRHFWNKHKRDNKYNEIFYRTMHPFFDEEGPDILFPKENGSPKRLSVMIQPNKYAIKEADRMIQEMLLPAFRIVLHDPRKPADLRTSGINVQPGYRTQISVTPSQLETSDDVKQLPIGRRNCKFNDESEGLQIFNEYSKEACLFECLLLISYAKCKCVPWNYPMANLTMEICDYLGGFCFEQVSHPFHTCFHFANHCPFDAGCVYR